MTLDTQGDFCIIYSFDSPLPFYVLMVVCCPYVETNNSSMYTCHLIMYVTHKNKNIGTFTFIFVQTSKLCHIMVAQCMNNDN